jgi:hypothetical protein
LRHRIFFLKPVNPVIEPFYYFTLTCEADAARRDGSRLVQAAADVRKYKPKFVNAVKTLSPGKLANPPKTILMSSVETAMPENIFTPKYSCMEERGKCGFSHDWRCHRDSCQAVKISSFSF